MRRLFDEGRESDEDEHAVFNAKLFCGDKITTVKGQLMNTKKEQHKTRGDAAKAKPAAKNENDNERGTDQFVRDLLRDIGVEKPWEQDGGPKWKRNALSGGSKSKAGKGEGKPEFVFVVDDFIVIIEDKKETRFTRFFKDEHLSTEFPYRQDYALNGTVHYAEAMVRNGIPYTKGIFAVGIGGDEHHHEIAVSFINQGVIKQLDDLDNLDVFAEDAIGEYHSVAVLGNKPQAEVRLDSVKAAASLLHEGMRNYGSVENDRKAPLVSAILLALEKPGFNIDELKGVYDQDLPDDWDGAKIYKAAHDYCGGHGSLDSHRGGIG